MFIAPAPVGNAVFGLRIAANERERCTGGGGAQKKLTKSKIQRSGYVIVCPFIGK
jgi:hypothetical protein